MPTMKKNPMNEAERKYHLAENYRHFAWRIMVYLKSHPDVLNANNNQEVYDAVREIQIQYHLKHTPKYTREDAAYFVDFMCELEAKREGAEFYVAQSEMDLYRPSAEKDEAWKMMFFIVLMAYDPGCYTKEIHEAVLAEEEAERKLKHNGKNG